MVESVVVVEVTVVHVVAIVVTVVHVVPHGRVSVVVVVVLSICLRFSFSLTIEASVTPKVAVVHVVTVVGPLVVAIAHGIVGAIPLSITFSFSLRLSKDRKDTEGCNQLK